MQIGDKKRGREKIKKHGTDLGGVKLRFIFREISAKVASKVKKLVLFMGGDFCGRRASRRRETNFRQNPGGGK